MRKFKGTKGPWSTLTAEQPVSSYSHTICSPSGCVGYWKGHKDWHDDLNWVLTKEDADLISAAPDLLEALQLISDELTQAWKEGKLPYDCTTPETVQKMNKAINKALGDDND